MVHASQYKLYEHRLERSEFALMIHGDSPTSRRLYDAFAYGTVPIIVSNRLWHVGMPFPGKVINHLQICKYRCKLCCLAVAAERELPS